MRSENMRHNSTACFQGHESDVTPLSLAYDSSKPQNWGNLPCTRSFLYGFLINLGSHRAFAALKPIIQLGNHTLPNFHMALL
jgi:hypothetical protein